MANYEGGSVSVLLGNGDGTFQAGVSYAAGGTPFSVAVGDLNGDGRADLVVPNFHGNNISVMLNTTVFGVEVTTASLPAGTAGVSYSAILGARWGTAPYSWSATTGLPAGLSLSNDGSISGRPAAEGASTIVVTVTDSGGQSASQSLTLTVKRLMGDFDNSGKVDILDLKPLVSDYGSTKNLKYDLNEDEVIDLFDLVILVRKFR
ncbi:MAG: putative Ig domain-containing protein [Bacillota bacterium]